MFVVFFSPCGIGVRVEELGGYLRVVHQGALVFILQVALLVSGVIERGFICHLFCLKGCFGVS